MKSTKDKDGSNVGESYLKSKKVIFSTLLVIVLLSVFAVIFFYFYERDDIDSADNGPLSELRLQANGIPDFNTVSELDSLKISPDIDSNEVLLIYDDILNNPDASLDVKQQVLDSTADFCHLSLDLECFENLMSDYGELNLDTSIIDSLMADFEETDFEEGPVSDEPVSEE